MGRTSTISRAARARMRISSTGSRTSRWCASSTLTALLLAAGVSVPLAAQSPRVVRSTEPPAWGSAVRLIPEMHIGEVDGEEAYLLGRVRSVAIGKGGAVIIADDKTPILRLYDARGTFVRDIGRSGEGPGEYRSMGGVRALPDGRILLWDNRIQRLTYYTAAGAVIKSVRVPSGLFAADLFQVDSAGFAYVRAVTGAVANDGNWLFGWIRVSPEGHVVDTIAVPRDERPADTFVLSGASGYDRPFSRAYVSTMSSQGLLLFGENTTYAFELRRSGKPVTRIERAYSAVLIVGDERREWEAWSRYFTDMQRTPLTNSQVAPSAPVRVKVYVIPREKPAFSELHSDTDGRIWVRRYVAAISRPGDERKPGDKRPRRVWKEQPTFDVFESSGRFLASVTLPWNARFEDAKGMSLWLTVTGELGEERVARYRMEAR